MLRNFYNTLRHFRMASALNIIGLSIAFASFTIIAIQVWNEFTAGMDEPKHKSIYRLETQVGTSDKWSTAMYRGIYERLAQSTPQIKASALFSMQSDQTIKVDEIQYTDIPVIFAITDISKVIEYTMIEGVFASTLEPNCVLINQSNAQRLFGDSSAMGRSLSVGTAECVVAGVYKDFAINSMSPNGIVISGDFRVCQAYFLFTDGTDVESIIAEFNTKYMATEFKDNGVLKAVALADTYFDNQYLSGASLKQGNRTTTMVLLSIAILIMVIALINFINFATALAPVRIRALNIRGVFGSTRTNLRMGMIVETLLFSFVSFIVALLWVAILKDSSLAWLLKTNDISIGTNWMVVAGVGFVALIIGLLAGIYPAYYCTRFTPALALRGRFISTNSKGGLRSSLIGIQLVISIVLIISSLFIHLQNRYIINKNLGYDGRNVIVVRGVWDRNADLVAQRVSGLSMVRSTARFDGSFGQGSGKSNVNICVGPDTVGLSSYWVEDGFLELMNVPIIQGRSLLPSDKSEELFVNNPEEIFNVVINKSALRELGTAVDSIIRGPGKTFRVVGVTDDIIGHSLYATSDLTLFVKSNYMNSVVARVDESNSAAVIEQIRTIVKEIQPYGAAEVDMYNTRVAALYQKEQNLAILITLFSLLAIFISLVGLFGLVLIETEARRREIGLRKINGATTRLILVMFNRKYIAIVSVCFIVAAPIAYYAVVEWLSSFPYRTGIEWWVFALALAIVSLVTMMTVTVQAWRTATENPIEALRS